MGQKYSQVNLYYSFCCREINLMFTLFVIIFRTMFIIMNILCEIILI